MTLNQMMNETFKQQSGHDWKNKAEETLKGKSIDILSRDTYENIKLKPLYTKEDLPQSSISQNPGSADFRRGFNELGYVEDDWKVAQKLTGGDPKILREKLLLSLEKGQSAISFHLDELRPAEFAKIVDGLHDYPLSLHTDQSLKEIFDVIEDANFTGYIAKDPIAVSAKTGVAVDEEWLAAITEANKKFPKLKTILVDASVYHNGGANAVQELAISVATGVNHIERLLNDNDNGMNIETILDKMVFNFSIGAHFFVEIAKLRAARLLWNKVAEAYGVEESNRKMTIAAETSQYTKTVYDPYVNMLRAGNEAFAAVLGGIQYLHVSPYNAPEGEASNFSDRVARNTQLILREEAHLKKIVDPAGGSYYIESITNQLAEKAWNLFLQIDEKGGMVEVLKSGWIQGQIAETRQKREIDSYSRKQSIIGTNIYANLQDKPLEKKAQSNVKAANTAFEVIPQLRLSEAFENLRHKSEALQKRGHKVEAGLLCLGELKAHKARMDFVTGFLAPGGINTAKSEGVSGYEEATSFIKETNVKHYFICGSNEQYDDTTIGLVKSIKQDHPEVKLYLAGLPAKEEQVKWAQAGISAFIHMRSNCYETLLSILADLEVEK
ncbi:methylmalonyl-CoA mutase family protein [Cytobacillus horneckiae]|uniref:methylmalonyl-CoA mutase family protein n=1 Tax=Cytobacillus horneckiae TaxID=549687 RepID=UPI003D9A4AA8